MEEEEKEGNITQKNKHEERVLTIESTGNYGVLPQDSNNFNDQDAFGDSILEYKLFKIKAWYGTIENTQCITGIQLFYKNRNTFEVFSPGEYKGQAVMEGSDELILEPNEYFVDFKIAVTTRVTNIEFITSNKRSFKIGGNTGEIKKTRLAETPNIILAAFGNYTDALTCMGVYYINRNSYFSFLFSGYFYLRYALKNEKYKEETIKNISKLGLEDKAILKVCLLPNFTFLNVMKFALC